MPENKAEPTNPAFLIRVVEHIAANSNPNKCPEPVLPEYAFIGRSNVGKSSLINMLVNHKGLARTSGTPGKTQTINHFLVDNSWYIVDLPGYGYAKVSKVQREKWLRFTTRYLRTRANLMTLFVLIDGRIPPQESDVNFINFLGAEQIPFIIAITKTDKVPSPQLKKNRQAVEEALKPTWMELPRFIYTSAARKRGREEILEFIQQTNLLFRPAGPNP
ncbi:MAG: ribosome biogenesis GTP-binding protein YihA/YsxC [Bacteroidales bacterium]|jgi:GTP-binding protein